MQVAVLGLGRMGTGIALRLHGKGHDVIAWNRSPRPEVQSCGVKVIDDLSQLRNLAQPRIVWVMLPAGEVTDGIIDQVLPLLDQGDILIDGGNSHYKESLRHHASVEAKGARFLDIGMSGGIRGEELGYCAMVGGELQAFAAIEPLLKDLCVEGGYSLIGPAGTGHYTKMVHNAIEYAMMQAIGEGFDVLKNGHYKDTLPLADIAELYRRGSIVSGTLMDCTAAALKKDAALSSITDRIDDNGEGRWTVQEALDHGVPFLMTSHALFSRYLSRQPESFAYKIIAAQRNEFGGHEVHKK